jgi:L-rhamnose-H+ transport protein
MSTLGLCFLFGAMWGAGGLTWGLMIRYLGVGLGLAIGCGLCASFGTLLPPLLLGEFAVLAGKAGGMAALTATLIGVGVGLLGIIVTGAAGMSKERELSEEQKKATVAEFNFSKGIVVAMFSGIMSAGMALGTQFGKGIGELALNVAPETLPTWKGLPCLVVVLLGGFVVNAGWCVLLNIKNRGKAAASKEPAPFVSNLIFSALAGAIWYSQMALYTMGNSNIGALEFSGGTVFMSATIIFSTLLGILLNEWKGSSRRTQSLLTAGLAILVCSLVIIAYGNYLKPPEDKPAATSDVKKTAALELPAAEFPQATIAAVDQRS